VNWNKFALASVVGAVLFVVIGFVWNVSLFGPYLAELSAGVARPEPMVSVAILGEVLRAVLLAYIFPFGYQGGAPWKEGLRFGVLMGLFSAMLSLIYVGVLNFSSFAIFWMDLAFFVIQGAIGGIGIALAYGMQGGKSR
jgi:hypothetical protein